MTLGSGVYRWTHPDPQATNAGTVATGARIFYRIGSEIQALDARTGARIWRSSFSANGAAVSDFSYADGGLYVVAGGSGTQSLFRLSATTGSLDWESYGPYDVQQPAALGGVVYLRQAGGGILALEASTRAVLWTTLVPSTDPGLLTVSGDSVVSPFRYGLAVLDRATGTVRWTTSSGVTGDVAVADGRVLCDCFDFGRGRELVTALDLRTGAKLWSTDGPGGTPVVAGGVVYAGSDQNVQALDPTSGKLLTTLALPELDPNSLPYLDAPVSVVDGSVIASVQNVGERFEGAGVYRFVLPDRDGAPAVRTVDDTVTGTGDNQVDYVGGWVAGSRPGAYQDTFHYARSRGALATLTFSGVGARIWYSAAPGFGRATVSLDGRPPITLDLPHR